MITLEQHMQKVAVQAVKDFRLVEYILIHIFKGPFND